MKQQSLYGLTVAIAAFVSSAVPGSASTTDSHDLMPRVTTGQVLQYDETDRLSGAVKHAHHKVITFRVLNASDSALTFQRVVAGKQPQTITIDFNRPMSDERSANFFFPRGFADGAPAEFVAGASWRTRIREESSLGQPGTAQFEVVSLDRTSGRLTIRGTLKGEGDSTDTAPGDTAPSKFHTTTSRTVTVVLTNGIIDTYSVSGDDKQSANGSTPIAVHIEMAYRRVK